MNIITNRCGRFNKIAMLGVTAACLLAAGMPDAKAVMVVTPIELTNNVMYGYNAPNQSIVVSNAGPGIGFVTIYISPNANWFNVSPTSWVFALGTKKIFTVSYSNQTVGLPPNTYTGQINYTFSDGAPTQTGTVSLNIMQMEVEPTSISTGAMEGFSMTSQTFRVWNSGATSFAYSAQTIEGATNFLSLSGATNGVAGSNTITIQFADGLPSGIYSGRVEVASSDGFGATNYVSVAAQVFARPVIEIQPTAMTQLVDKGSNPAPQSFTVRNGSVGLVVPMIYTLAYSNQIGSELIQSLDSVGGTSTGQADSVNITYMGISTGTGMVFNALVHIDTVDAGTGYWPTGTLHISTNMTVQVLMKVPNAPSGVTASGGTYTNYVVVSWNPVAEVRGYKVYRSLTFDWTLAEPIGGTEDTTWNDQSGMPGILYYYWVSSINYFGGEGAVSTNLQTGYRRLSSPGGVFATDGSYTDRVRVTWPLVDGATGYRVYRGIEGGSLSPLYFTAGGLYDDMDVVVGVHYEYRVGATNAIFGSELSVGEIGYAFGTPDGFSASQGAYLGKIRLTWNAVESASGYEVWRSKRTLTPPNGGASMLTAVTLPTYDDMNLESGTVYYYWVRGENMTAGIGGWSAMAMGYGAAAGVNLWVNDLVVLPIQVGAGSSPSIISFRIGNGGGSDMAGANGTIGIEFYASTNAVFGAGNEILIGRTVTAVTLAVGADMVMNMNGTQVTMPNEEGDYYIFVRVLPGYPSFLAETNPNDNMAKRTGAMRIRSSGGMNYQVFNDYDGDGISDLGIYRNNEWSILSVDGRILVVGAKLFSGAVQPVLGDLDGDRKSDPIVYDSSLGMWQTLSSVRGYSWLGGIFGGPGYRGMTADYEGIGHGDASIYLEWNGRWYILLANGNLIEWNWGGAGYEPVTGDYNGDGCWDLAVYQEATGLWYIKTLYGQLVLTSMRWGGQGFRPVPGDFDGDGRWDLAVYQEATGLWYVMSPDERVISQGIPWGGAGHEPVMGDYDGDGKWDFCVYQEATGLWYIRTVDSRVLAWASPWGGPGYRPIGN